MNGARFIGGPYDGAEFAFTERMPAKILLEIECCNVDTEDSSVREAISVNLGSDPLLDELVFMRNAKSHVTEYVLENDEGGTPLYRLNGWQVSGTSNSEA